MKPRLSDSISDATWRDLIEKARCKAERADAHFVEVDPRNTSQLCSGYGGKVPKELSVRGHNAALADPPEGEASLAAIELGIDEAFVIENCKGERVRGTPHSQTVSNRHSQIKGFLRRFRGIATKCLDSCPR